MDLPSCSFADQEPARFSPGPATSHPIQEPSLPHRDESKYISGIIEGFYGKPWSEYYRLQLLDFMRTHNLNTYIYAPKDDAKHRKRWREKYTAKEADDLHVLIAYSEFCNVEFVYAISPGIDIEYSCEKDLQALCDKVDQVKDLGCRSFAVLFDDIDKALLPIDDPHFDSSAQAQVFLANHVYDHLKEPRLFFFCPTEYCRAMAKGPVHKSEYLVEVGKYLHENIQVFWTGRRIVSSSYTTDELVKISKVLKRKPVIWDNLYANDYCSSKRIFTGPFEGRPVEIRNHSAGLILNPNCQYGANFVAFSCFSDWLNAKLYVNGIPEETFDPISSHRKAVVEWMNQFNMWVFASRKMQRDAKALLRFEKWKDGGSNDYRTYKEVLSDFIWTQKDFVGVLPHGVSLPPFQETTTEAIMTFIECFYLPFSYGDYAKGILNDFVHLRENLPVARDGSVWEASMHIWKEVCSRLKGNIGRYLSFFRNLMQSEPVYTSIKQTDLNPFLWELNGILSVMDATIDWMSAGSVMEHHAFPFVINRSWESVSEGEPWSTTLSFTEHCARVISPHGSPLVALLDSFLDMPLVLSALAIRKITEDDLKDLSFLRRTEDASEYSDFMLFEDTCDLRFQAKFFRIFLRYDNRFAFVAQDMAVEKPIMYKNICAIAGSLDVRKHVEFLKNDVLPELKAFFTSRAKSDLEQSSSSLFDEPICMVERVESDVGSFVPPLLPAEHLEVSKFPSYFDIRCSGSFDCGPALRLVQMIGIAFAYCGSDGMYTTVHNHEMKKAAFLESLRFIEIHRTNEHVFLAYPLKPGIGMMHNPHPPYDEGIEDSDPE